MKIRNVYCYRCGDVKDGVVVDSAYGYDHVKCDGCKWTATYPNETFPEEG